MGSSLPLWTRHDIHGARSATAAWPRRPYLFHQPGDLPLLLRLHLVQVLDALQQLLPLAVGSLLLARHAPVGLAQLRVRVSELQQILVQLVTDRVKGGQVD